MAIVYLGERAKAKISKANGDHLPCINYHLSKLSGDPSLGRPAPRTPYGWWSGLIYQFSCDGFGKRLYYTAFYLLLDDEDGIIIEDLGQS